MVDDDGLLTALVGLRSHLLAGDLDDLTAETLGPEYALLRRVSLAAQIALTDWDDHEHREPGVSADPFEVEYRQERMRQILKLWRRLRPIFVDGSTGPA